MAEIRGAGLVVDADSPTWTTPTRKTRRGADIVKANYGVDGARLPEERRRSANSQHEERKKKKNLPTW